jgi:hypothetical protein
MSKYVIHDCKDKTYLLINNRGVVYRINSKELATPFDLGLACFVKASLEYRYPEFLKEGMQFTIEEIK